MFDLDFLETTLQSAIASKRSAYVARSVTGHREGIYIVNDNGDGPEAIGESDDAIAYIGGNGNCHGLGRASQYINLDGTVDRSYFGD